MNSFEQQRIYEREAVKEKDIDIAFLPEGGNISFPVEATARAQLQHLRDWALDTQARPLESFLTGPFPSLLSLGAGISLYPFFRLLCQA